MRSFPEIAGLETSTPGQAHGAPIRVLVSEPDAVSRRLICSLLEYEPGMTVTCVDDSRLVSSIQESPPDLVILDVHTPAIRRAPSWEALGIKSAPVTIVTAYDASAVSAFASTAIDFLVKPFDAERFEAALDRANSGIARARTELAAEELSSGREQRRPGRQFLQRLAVEANEKIVLVKVEDIRWMQSSGNHIRLHVAKASYLMRQSMKNLQALLEPSRFLRVHRNAIVNLDHVEEFHLPPNGNMFVKLNDGLCLPLRKANRALLRKLLKRHFVT
ncbi:MAG TPA: LytTR family DNA-binding domain-containing protein [Terriglobales bacterium]|nr:LytTR family DNA-binding domain-containing protein [Terriglobales bacterium]